ncbi:hypothetical protein [Halobaculum magnesiiphilum]|uniref:Uncharacterized protein n=1 Tax=Halobaculum magnesiiphilum TaxID=1017351 RepID=A0A8T8W9P9_9EURY|nr:hypothetical protein [Halobaculum magnesiiphilum]QZP36582.1 hypothetical protein K6T50_09665 [Halobaculum magnesiiphilum]
MYEARLGTDWEDISGTEAIRRAYALGVAAAFGYENREEFDRLRSAPDTSYDRSIIDLAYQEGKHEAEVVHADSDAIDGDDVWDQLVEGTAPSDAGFDDTDDLVSGSPVARPITAIDFPSALERAGLLDGGKIGALGFPALLGSAPDSGTPDEDS